MFLGGEGEWERPKFSLTLSPDRFGERGALDLAEIVEGVDVGRLYPKGVVMAAETRTLDKFGHRQTTN